MKKLLAITGICLVAGLTQAANYWNLFWEIAGAYGPDGSTPVLDDYSVTWSLVDASSGNPIDTLTGAAGSDGIVYGDLEYNNYLSAYESTYIKETDYALGSHDIYQYIKISGADGEYEWKSETGPVTVVGDLKNAPESLPGIGAIIGQGADQWTKVGGDTTVPEPATMSLLGLGALAMALRRKLRK